MSVIPIRSEASSRGARMLRTALGPEIAAWLEDASVIEVMLNPDGRLWIDRLGAGIADTGSGMSAADGERIIRLVAHHVGAEVHGRAPRVSAELPETGERFEGLLPPVVAAPSFAIRKPAVAVFTLDDYVAAGIMAQGQADALARAVETKKNILVAGGTSTGKTTLTNALLAEVAPTADRVVLIEDTRELQCAAPNLVSLRTKDGVASLSDLVRSALRLRPDRIPIGEVRGAEALDLLKAWGTGHPGGVGILLVAWAIVIIAFFILSIQLFITLIEFKLTTLCGFVLIPFGLFGKTAFMAERVLGNVISSGIKVLVLAVIVGIGSTIFSDFTSAISGEPTIEDALSIVLASLSLLGLGIFGPGIANGIVSGGPQLGAGAAAGTALLAGGAAAGAVAGARMAGGAVASAASNVAHGTSRSAGGATMAYALGSAGKSGASAVGSGMAAVGDAAVGAATSPLKKAGDSMRQSFRDGSRAAITNTGGSITPGPNAPPAPPADAEQSQPAWAKAMKDRQTITHSATLAAHTLKAGDSHAGGASIDVSEKD